MKLLILVAIALSGFVLTTRVIPFLFKTMMKSIGLPLRSSPITRKRVQRFKSMKRGYASFVLLSTLFTTSFFLEVIVNDKPLYIRFQEQSAWPAFRDLGNLWLPGNPFRSYDEAQKFGFSGSGQLDYRAFGRLIVDPDNGLRQILEQKQNDYDRYLEGYQATREEVDQLRAEGEEPEDWLLEEYSEGASELAAIEGEIRSLEGTRDLFAAGAASAWWPLYRHSPRNTRLDLPGNAPYPPSVGIALFEGGRVETGVNSDGTPRYVEVGAWDYPLGTDSSGIDVLPQLLYGFRVSVSFALVVLIIGYGIGVVVGGLMGYYGGWTDLLIQRLIEIWGSIPFLFTMMIIGSVFDRSYLLMVILLILLRSWLAITYLIRGEFYREKARDYVQSALGVGVRDWQVMTKHILPNSMVPIISRAPFSFVNYITILVSLDFLGFGMPPTVPSWGRLLKEGHSFLLTDPHLVAVPVLSLGLALFLAVLIGEAVREAFDPKVFSRLR